jgi:hypothetical protein
MKKVVIDVNFFREFVSKPTGFWNRLGFFLFTCGRYPVSRDIFRKIEKVRINAQKW